MSHDEFTKLFKYMETMRSEMNQRFDNVDKRFNDVQVDGLAKLIMDYNQEMLMIAHKVDRMERWIHEIAQKTGVKLTYES